jgi:hypothetical protein
MHKSINTLIEFIKDKDGKVNKSQLANLVQREFKLVHDRSVYSSDYFAIRFSESRSSSFSNTVISLSALQKYDDMPFIVCLVTPHENLLYLANTTFLSRVSHSSQELRVDNIRGSINGSDIVKIFNNLPNSPQYFDDLFSIHVELGFAENLPRLVEATNNISPSGKKFIVENTFENLILLSPERAANFVNSNTYSQLRTDLDEKVALYRTEILIAGFIKNVNVRGRIIEYLIAGEDESLRQELIDALHSNEKQIPRFKTDNDLGDYTRIFDKYTTATDVKTKLMLLNSNPKAYNIDKLLEFLAKDNTVFMFYFVGIEPDRITNQVLISMFQSDLLRSTVLLKHWAGRNSRGVTQFEGKTLNRLIVSPNNRIDIKESKDFLNTLIQL